MSVINLCLDDIRIPSDVKGAWHKGEWRDYPLLEWTIVRSYADFVKFIETNGLPTKISFDHDLADTHYPKSREEMYQPIDYSKYTEKTGYCCAKWLVEYCLDKKLDLPEFYVHSFNPVGRMNIANYLTGFQRFREST
jgi:hypothetical protein